MDRHDWKFNPQLFKLSVKLLGEVSFDMFATDANKHLPKFVSRRPQPGQCLWVDAFSRSWLNLPCFWGNPPFVNALILKILSKIQREKAECILLLPAWTTAIWFPLVVEMSVGVVYFEAASHLFLRGERPNRAFAKKSSWAVISVKFSHNSASKFLQTLVMFFFM